MVLPKTAEGASAIAAAGLLHGHGSAHAAGGDPGDRRRAGVTGARQAALQGEHGQRQLQRSLAEPRDVHRRLTAQGGVPRRVQGRRQRRAVRIAADRAADWHDQARLAHTRQGVRCPTDWKDMQVPGNWESRGLEDFDGVVWFTRTIEAPQGAGEMTLSLGRISNTAEVWVNGLSVAQNVDPAAGCGHRRGARRRPWWRWPRCGAGCGRTAGGRPRQSALRAADRHAEAGRRTRSRCASPTTATTAASSARRRRCSRRPARRGFRWPAPGSTASSGRAMPVRCTRSRASWRHTSRWPIPPHPRRHAAGAGGSRRARRRHPSQREVRERCSSTRPS